MENIYVVSGIISVAYLLFKFAEMRCLNKESKPFKELFKDAFMVFLSVIVGNFTYKQMQPLGKMILGDGNTEAFTDAPSF